MTQPRLTPAPEADRFAGGPSSAQAFRGRDIEELGQRLDRLGGLGEVRVARVHVAGRLQEVRRVQRAGSGLALSRSRVIFRQRAGEPFLGRAVGDRSVAFLVTYRRGEPGAGLSST